MRRADTDCDLLHFFVTTGRQVRPFTRSTETLLPGFVHSLANQSTHRYSASHRLASRLTNESIGGTDADAIFVTPVVALVAILLAGLIGLGSG
jgi:hypothetical protein